MGSKGNPPTPPGCCECACCHCTDSLARRCTDSHAALSPLNDIPCRLPMPIDSVKACDDTAHGPTQHPYGEPLKVRRGGKVRPYFVTVRANGKGRCITSSNPASIVMSQASDAARRSSEHFDDRPLPHDIEDGLGEYIKHTISYSP